MKLLVGLALFTALVAVSSAQKNIVCYFASWTIYRPGNGKFAVADIDSNLCTHILYGFVGLGPDNKVQILDDWEFNGLHEVEHLMALKMQNPSLKVSVSMGGWNEGSGKYSKMAADPNARSTFVQDVVQFLDKYKFDGFDLDWEYPGQRDGSNPVDDPTNFVKLLKELKVALSRKNKELSIGVAARTNISYPDVKTISDNVDIIMIQTYNLYEEFDKPVTSHNSPLYTSSKDKTEDQKKRNIAAIVQHWLDQGADPKKVHIGISAYVQYMFKLIDPNKHDIYDPAKRVYTEHTLYSEICKLNWTETFDNEQKVPHKYHDYDWISYDNIESVTLKAQFVKEKNLGGIFFWTMDTDDFRGDCGDEKYPLIGAINKVLKK